MTKFFFKIALLLIKVTVAVIVIAMILATAEAFNDGTRQVGSLLWRALCAIGHDICTVTVQFWHQAGNNLSGLAAGAEHDTGFNLFRWFFGGPVEIFHAFCQTAAWWTDHGKTRYAMAYLVGVPLMAFLFLPHIGNINIGGGGGGASKGSKSGGHH